MLVIMAAAGTIQGFDLPVQEGGGKKEKRSSMKFELGKLCLLETCAY